MKHYRTSIEIIAEILKIANGGNVTRTKIMYSAFLNYFQLKEYLPMLTERGLIRYNPDTRMFKTTEKGLMLLETYNMLVDLMLKKKTQE
ncbi:MAG: winged helix-turn-helix domain-containing protein [Nitrososphaeraceae archaeon]